ncbi:MAG: Nif3-like dinuclear metal center hexameric protein [Clostridia bacterium]|nr:Nif3-like dinuclear metal center hexameric protein [Clostridia bacterium]
MNILALERYFEDKFPRALSATWDNDGLSCAPDPTREVKRVLIALDVTDRVAERAVSGGFDVLLTHHPLLFRGIKALVPVGAVPKKLLKLALGGVAAFSFHTRLDAVQGGVNDILAQALGVLDAVPFAPEGEVPCGRIGMLAEPVTVADFAKTVKAVLGAPAVNVAGTGTVQKIALLGGEGADFLAAAKVAGAELFLSGHIGYHRMLDAPEEGIAAIEAGHYYTEFPVCDYLREMVLNAIPDAYVEIMETDTIQTV